MSPPRTAIAIDTQPGWIALALVGDALPVGARQLRRLARAGAIDWVATDRRRAYVHVPRAAEWCRVRYRSDVVDRIARTCGLPAATVSSLRAACAAHDAGGGGGDTPPRSPLSLDMDLTPSAFSALEPQR